MTVRTLRAERDRGRLETWIIGRWEYTSLAEVRRMIELCQAAQRAKVPDRRQPTRNELPAPVPGAALRSLELLEDRLRERREADAGGAVRLARATADRLRK